MTCSARISKYLHVLETHYFTPEKGLLASFDAVTGAPVLAEPIIEDMGDTIPFILHCGGHDLAERQMKISLDVLERSPWIQSRTKTLRRSFIETYDWSDLLLGLELWRRETGDQRAEECMRTMLTVWLDTFERSSRYSGLALRNPLNKKPLTTLPVARAIDVGMFPEILALWSETQGREWLDHAHALLKSWLTSSFFQKYGLFPCVSPEASLGGWISPLAPLIESLIPKTGLAVLFKHNTNFLASLLAVYETRKSPELLRGITSWVKGLQSHLLTPEGGVLMGWSPHGRTAPPNIFNFQVIDLLCDAAPLAESVPCLKSAESIADFWLTRQGETGLFPQDTVGPRARIGVSDSQTDMAVALLKLSELTGRQCYKTAAEACIFGMEKYLDREWGMADKARVDTGELTSTVCKTKFLTLSFKARIALEQFGNLTRDRKLKLLLMDR